jgi:hypothetical protein
LVSCFCLFFICLFSVCSSPFCSLPLIILMALSTICHHSPEN